MQITFVTACSPYHSHFIPAIQAQVAAQTVACAQIIIEDHERRGPGAARNAGLARVETPFVAFLDADDQIAPTWAAETLGAFNGRYIYTDHLQGEKLFEAPRCAWVRNTWHVITALIPTAWVRSVGGFDETLPAFEDTDLFLRLISTGHCGARLARPLFEYGAGGQRSTSHFGTPVYDAVMRYFSRQYGGRTMGSCCGDPQPGDLIATGEHLDGDVMAEAAWAGNRPQRGRASGRVYRTGNYKRTWVAPADVAAQPELWRLIAEQELNGEVPDFIYASFAGYVERTGDHGGAQVGVDEISAFIMQGTQPPPDYAPPPEAVRVDDTPPTTKHPSAAAIRAKAHRARKAAERRAASAAQ